MIRVIIADDHALFRAGLIALFDRIGGIRVIGEAADGMAAITMVTERQPEVILLDVEMPGPATSTVIPRLRRLSPKIVIIVVTMHGDRMLATRLRELGASDVVSKSVSAVDLVARIWDVLSQQPSVPVPLPTGGRLLSSREVEVLHYVSLGKTNAEIAEVLSLAPATVKRHLANIGARLGTANRMESVTKARALRLLHAR